MRTPSGDGGLLEDRCEHELAGTRDHIGNRRCQPWSNTKVGMPKGIETGGASPWIHVYDEDLVTVDGESDRS